MVDYNDAIWVVPEPLGGPDDGFLARTAVDYVVGGQAVYYVERSRDLDQMVKVWRQGASAAGQLGVVTVYGDQLTDEDEDALRALAEAARLVVITAYDGEGAVFFTRKSDEAFDHLG